MLPPERRSTLNRKRNARLVTVYLMDLAEPLQNAIEHMPPNTIHPDPNPSDDPLEQCIRDYVFYPHYLAKVCAYENQVPNALKLYRVRERGLQLVLMCDGQLAEYDGALHPISREDALVLYSLTPQQAADVIDNAISSWNNAILGTHKERFPERHTQRLPPEVL